MRIDSVLSRLPGLNAFITGLALILAVVSLVLISLHFQDISEAEAREAALLEEGYGYMAHFAHYPAEQAIKNHCQPANAVIVDGSHRLIESASVGGPFLLYCK